MDSTASVYTITQEIRRCFVRFPHINEVMKRLEDLYTYECREEEAEHFMLLGEPGVGKSTLLKRFRDSHPPIIHQEYTEIPVLYANVEPGCSIKKLASAMLLALGSEFWNRGDERELTHQLVCLLRGCKVRIVILDEVNHLVDRGGEKTHHNIADWIKSLSDSVSLPFVLAGIPRSERLLMTNDQLRGRFREVITIQPFSVESEKAVQEFCSVLKTFSGLTRGISSIDLSTETIAIKFAFATMGRLREIRKLLVRAVELAFEKSDRKLTIAVLVQAFREVIYRNAPEERNPFCEKFDGTPLIKAGEPFAPVER